MRNTYNDLHNTLMAQLERLDDEDLTPEQLDKEVIRTKSMQDLSKVIIENGKLSLEAVKLSKGIYNNGGNQENIPSQFGLKNSTKTEE